MLPGIYHIIQDIQLLKLSINIRLHGYFHIMFSRFIFLKISFLGIHYLGKFIDNNKIIKSQSCYIKIKFTIIWQHIQFTFATDSLVSLLLQALCLLFRNQFLWEVVEAIICPYYCGSNDPDLCTRSPEKVCHDFQSKARDLCIHFQSNVWSLSYLGVEP